MFGHITPRRRRGEPSWWFALRATLTYASLCLGLLFGVWGFFAAKNGGGRLPAELVFTALGFLSAMWPILVVTAINRRVYRD
jgi:hypothetical protein